eukprot:41432_1
MSADHLGEAGEVEKRFHEILRAGEDTGAVWTDPDFPASDQSLFAGGARMPSKGGLNQIDINWKRPADILKSIPELLTVNGNWDNGTTYALQNWLSTKENVIRCDGHFGPRSVGELQVFLSRKKCQP